MVTYYDLAPIWRDLLNEQSTARRMAERSWSPDIRTLMDEQVENQFSALLLHRAPAGADHGGEPYYEELNRLAPAALRRLRQFYSDMAMEGFLLAEAERITDSLPYAGHEAITHPAKRRKSFEENIYRDFSDKIRQLHCEINGDSFTKFYEPYLDKKVGSLYQEALMKGLPKAAKEQVRKDAEYLYNMGFSANDIEHRRFQGTL